MLRLKLRSDKTVIVDSDLEERLKGVTKVVITHETGTRPEAEIHILSEEAAKYDAQVDATFLVASTNSGEMKPVKAIEFEDGEVINYGDPE